ncbi:MAG TPA: uroporphyrinogen decarboxylase family protein [Methylococcales bacterium]
MKVDIQKIINLYKKRESERYQNMLAFYYGSKGYLVTQRGNLAIFGPCNSVDMIVRNNLTYIEKCLENDFTDDIPFLEPWIGVGVYANAFGCDYVWSDIDAPQTHYKYHRIDEVRNIDYPDWTKSPVMKMVIGCIDALKEETKGQIPLLLTDTQSPFDTATLILDTCEFFTACYFDEETVIGFMKKITDLIIEFSKVQIQHIGEDLLGKPGHNVISCTGFEGIAISDDNLAVSSPKINQKIALPFNQIIADTFGGLGIHSCGRWTETMKLLKNNPVIKSIDCALGKDTDPTPNDPAELRRTLKDSKIIAKVRVGNNFEEIEHILDTFISPDIKTVVELDYNQDLAEFNYTHVRDKLERIYENKSK